MYQCAVLGTMRSPAHHRRSPASSLFRNRWNVYWQKWPGLFRWCTIRWVWFLHCQNRQSTWLWCILSSPVHLQSGYMVSLPLHGLCGCSSWQVCIDSQRELNDRPAALGDRANMIKISKNIIILRYCIYFKPECTAPALFGFDPVPAAVHVDYLFDDRKPESCAHYWSFMLPFGSKHLYGRVNSEKFCMRNYIHAIEEAGCTKFELLCAKMAYILLIDNNKADIMWFFLVLCLHIIDK